MQKKETSRKITKNTHTNSSNTSWSSFCNTPYFAAKQQQVEEKNLFFRIEECKWKIYVCTQLWACDRTICISFFATFYSLTLLLNSSFWGFQGYQTMERFSECRWKQRIAICVHLVRWLRGFYELSNSILIPSGEDKIYRNVHVYADTSCGSSSPYLNPTKQASKQKKLTL